MRKITLKFQILTTLFGLLLSMSIYAQNPGGVSGASLWLKADGSRSNSGSNVTDWNDQTGINNFSVIGSPQVEFYAINFKPVISFVNANPDPSATLPTTRLNGNTPISYVDGFAVYKNSANQTTVIGSTQPGTNFGVGIFAGGNSTDVFVSNGTASTNQRFDNQNVSQFGIVNLDVSLASAPFATGRLNSQPQTMTDGGGGNFDTINFTPMIGGSNNNGAVNGWHAFNGQLAEVVLFPTSLSITDKIKVESYLAIKYGISLGNNTTSVAYTSSAGTTIWTADATYKNDIFGIGKDDGSGLNQTLSNSLNTGSGDGTGQSGKGNIVLSTPSSLDNNDFLIIGHDNGALTEQTTDLPSSLAGGKRLGREWKVKHTNDVGTITLKFSTLGLTLSGASLADFKLLFDTDGNGNFADGTVTEVVPTSISGNELVFNTVALPQDAVFTFMTQKAPVGPGVLGANLWLKADAGITQSSGKVSSWANQGSMSNADATQSLASKQPTLITSGANQINFQPILSFDGTDDTMATPILSGLLGGTPGNETATQFVVYRHVGSNYDNLYNASDLSGPWKIGFNNVGQMLQQNLKSDPTSLVQSGEVALADMTATTLSSGSSTLNLNINGTSGQTVGGDYKDIPNSPLNFGTYAGKLFQVNISELVVYPSILSDSDRNKVQSYLALKYGISLGDNTAAVAYTNSAGTTIWAADATYKNDIFGIGKDDGNGLNQISSNSMNTGSGDGTGQSGKGNIVVSSPSSLDTNDFLIIGHDNGALTEQTTDLPIDENGNNRFAREWKVKHTGDVGTVNLQFDLTGLCLSGIQASDYTLVIDADGNGNFTDGTITKITASTLVSNKVTFNNVSLPNNAVFTFMGTPSKLALTSNTSTTSQTVCNNNAITPITYSVTNATGVNATDLPNGVAAVYNNGVITLSGTPTVAGTFNYTLTVISSQCTPAPTATGTISVTATNTVSNASTAPTLCQNSIVSPITHTTTGATGIGTAIGLPTGVQALWSANTITISGTPTVSGIFNYTIPLTGGCGTVNATGTITVTTKPSQPIITAAGPTAFCTPGSVVLSSDAVSGNQWYKDGNPINGATASTYTAIDSGSYTVISTSNNCTSESSDPIVVTANATPSPPTIKPNKATTACQGDVVKLHTSSPTNKWFKDGTEIPNETSNTLSVTSSGSYTVESINPSGCISGLSAPIVVTISPYPVVDVIAGNTVVCAASTLQLTNATVAGVWTSDNTGIATVDGNGLVTGVNAGTVTISYTVTNAGGCSTTVTKSITVTPKPSQPTITAAGPTAFCIPGSVLLTSNATSGNQWYKDGTAINGATAATYTAIDSGSYTVISTINNCTSDTSNAIAVLANPTPTVNPIAGNAIVCAASTLQLTNTTAAGVWKSKNTGIATVDGNGLVTGVNAGTVTISYTVTNSSGCTTSVSKSISVTAKPSQPIITAAGPTAFCTPGSVVLSSSALSGNQWYKDGVAIGGATASTYTAIDSGSYTVSSTINNCTSDTSNAIAVLANPTPTVNPIAGNSVLCAASTLQLSNATAAGVWTSNNTGIATVDGNGLVTGVNAGTVIISYTVTNANGCSNSVTKSISVTAKPSQPTITAAGPTAFCTPGSVVLTSDVTSGNQWYKDGVAISGATAATYTATTTGSYTVISTLNNCTSISSNAISVVANPKPNVNPIIGNATINVGTTTQLSNTTAGGVWNSSNPTLATVTSTGLVTGINNGDVIITYTVTNASGCSNSQSLLVKVNPFQLVAIDDDFGNTPINSAKGATLNVLSNDLLNDSPISIAQIVITVTNTDGLNDIVVDNQGNVIIPIGSPVGNYTLSYAICDSKNSNNCTTAQIKIVIKDPCDFDDSPSSCDIVVNNAISPNNDGYNDLFIIEKIENYPNNSVEIFDRYGKPVFRIEGYNNTSNVFKGISNGPITVNKDDYLANGTYYYVIKYNKPLSGNTNQKTGYLFLSR